MSSMLSDIFQENVVSILVLQETNQCISAAEVNEYLYWRTSATASPGGRSFRLFQTLDWMAVLCFLFLVPFWGVGHFLTFASDICLF